MGLCACLHAHVGKEECVHAKNKRESKGGGKTQGSEKDTKFKGTGSKARNPWAMTVSFKSGNRAGISSAFKISMSVYQR